jgi:hypothetical protein
MHCASAVQLNLKHRITTKMHCASAVQLSLKQYCYKKALHKCSTTKFETQSYYTNALYKCSTIKFETQSHYTNSLCKCNTIVLLDKALLQGVPSQFMQLLSLKHNLTTQMHCASAVQLNLKHSPTTQMHCASAVHLNLKHSPTTQMHCASAVHLNLKQSYYKNALYKCKTIILLNKALLQGMHPQLMQLLNLKHNLINCTNALNKCSPTKFETHPACSDKLRLFVSRQKPKCALVSCHRSHP